MVRPSLAVLVVANVALAGEPAADDAVRREQEKLIGTWKVVSVEMGGQKFPDQAIQDFRFIFTADTLTRKRGEKAESGSGYRLDPSKSPKWIDMTGVTDGKPQSVPAIYALNGDCLTLCFRADYKKPEGKPGGVFPRPAKLEAGKDSGQVLMVLKREK